MNEKSLQEVKDNGYCDNCPALAFMPDPDPFDWFRDNDQKAVCTELKVTIAGGLENYSDKTNIRKPPFCPKLERELTADEIKKAADALNWAAKQR